MLEVEEVRKKNFTLQPSRRVEVIDFDNGVTACMCFAFQSEQPLDKLQVIHRYRPHSNDIPPIVENGRVQNYSHHVGSALHAKHYVDYYMKEGS